MKKTLLWISLILVFLVACGDNDDVENPPQNDTQEQDVTDEQDLTGEADESPADTQVPADHPYPFTQFDLDVDMEDDLDIIEVEYEQERDETEASYYDRNQDIQLNGDEAMEELDRIFASFEFDETSSKEEVLDAVRTGFQIPDDAKRVEVELEFLDGTEVEFVEEKEK